MNRTTDCIERMIAIIEKGWTIGTVARDAHGNQTSVNSVSAVSFCTIGALYLAAHQAGLDGAEIASLKSRVSAEVVASTGHVSTSGWNDAQASNEPVIALLGRVLEMETNRPGTEVSS